MQTRIKPHFSENALIVLEKRYLAKDKNGQICETPEGLFERVASNVATAELLYDANTENKQFWEEKFYEIMANLEFLPNSPTLMNAGRDLQQLSACFVLPIDDSMESIFETIKNTALIHKSGGGTGFSFSNLRPKDDIVLSTGGVASGPLSFMKVFNAATDAVKQGGTRRGANMAVLSVDHPDIFDFIKSKTDRSSLNNFNISVAVTDAFMQAVLADDTFPLRNPRTKEVVKTISARELFSLIVEMSWDSGEPGLIFIDRMNEDNPLPKLGRIESTNPCGEQPLLPYEACNLGSINLAKFISYINGKAEIDYKKLEEIINISVRFLDDVIDVNKYPIDLIAQTVKLNRKIGLGVMGFADMLIMLGIPYNSDEAVELGKNLMCFIREKARKASAKLAKERGPFPNFEKSIYFEKNEAPLRNSTCTTIAPTGTLSILANCSSGIEPLYAIAYYRNILDNQKFIEVNPLFLQTIKERGLFSESLMQEIANSGTIQNISYLPDDIKKLFVCAHDVSPEYHVRMQAAFQKGTDNAVSKTVNLKQEATKEDVKRILLMAYKEGCKGITLYRDGSRQGQVLSTSKSNEKEKSLDSRPSSIVPRQRPMLTYGSTEKVMTGFGNLGVTVKVDDEEICEGWS